MSKIPTTPQDLIAALQSDGEIDNARWEQFDALYRPVIRLFLEQKFGSRLASHAEDVAQEVMIRLVAAFRNRQYSAEKGHFRRYLAAMSYNAGVNALRRLQPERTQSLETVDLEALSRDAIADEATERIYGALERQFREALYQRMARTYLESFAHDPTDRAVLEAYYRGESSTETARRLGKTSEAVRQQRNRILKTLKALALE